MNIRKQVSWCVTLWALALGSAWATPVTPSQLVVFGDSLSDGGNAAAAILGSIPESQQGNPEVLQQAFQTIPFSAEDDNFVPSAPYLLGPDPLASRFSNGPVWVERLADALGLPLNPALLGGTNFAFGGADSGPLPGVPTDPIPSLTRQVGLYLGGLEATQTALDQDALFVVFGGGNDLRALGNVTANAGEEAFIASLQTTGNLGAALLTGVAAGVDAFKAVIRAGGSADDAAAAAAAATQEAFVGVLLATGDIPAAQAAADVAAFQAAQSLIAASATNLLGVVDTLLQAGAINLLIPLVPDVSLTPDAQNLSPETRALISSLSFGLNHLLLQSLVPLSANPDLNINILDTFSLFGGIVDNPQHFGLTNASDACITTAVCSDPSEYLFWDGIHPTAAGHEILANAALSMLIPEPGSLVLMGIGLLIIGWSLKRRYR